jgi:hypothetical protein
MDYQGEMLLIGAYSRSIRVLPQVRIPAHAGKRSRIMLP